jgi:hypothetical protein
LHQSPRCYSAIVANKIIHGGGRVPALSHRVTLFLLLSPKSTFPAYDATIPVSSFLHTNLATGEIMLPSKSIHKDDIQAWCDVVNVSFHYQLENEHMSPFQKSLVKELQYMENRKKRIATEELESTRPPKRTRLMRS